MCRQSSPCIASPPDMAGFGDGAGGHGGLAGIRAWRGCAHLQGEDKEQTPRCLEKAMALSGG